MNSATRSSKYQRNGVSSGRAGKGVGACVVAMRAFASATAIREFNLRRRLKRWALLASIPVCAWSTISSAAGQSTSVRISEIAISRQSGNYIYIRMEQAPTGAPGCSNNGYWHFTLPLDEATSKNIYAMLLAAHAAQKIVTIQGTNACTERADIESLQVAFSPT